MGTRADFYVGQGKDAEWLGSIAFDGYPEGAVSALQADSKAEWRRQVAAFLAKRDDATLPEDGWPWPWDDSHLTDYAYTFEDGAILCSSWGQTWQTMADALKAADEDEQSVEVPFPDMRERKRVTMGRRSGLIVIGPQGIVDDET